MNFDQWGFAYRAVERPGVREMVAADVTRSAHWRFVDLYLAQRGMGAEGDRPHEFNGQFAVRRERRGSGDRGPQCWEKIDRGWTFASP